MKNYKGFRKNLVPLLVSILLLLSLMTAARESKRIAQAGKNPSPYEKQRTAELESYLESGKNYFEMAEFTFAQIFYDKALRLNKDNPAIQARIEECKKYRARQKELLRTAPKGEKRKDYLKAKYKTAVRLYKDDNYRESKKQFEEIWLLALKGDYKSTKKYLRKIDEKLDEQAKEAAMGKISQKDRKRIDDLLEDGKKRLKKDDYSGAIARFDEVLKIDRENKDAKDLQLQARKELKAALSKKQKPEQKVVASKEEEAKKKAEQLKKQKELEEKEKKEQERLAAEKKKKEQEEARIKAEQLKKQKASEEAERIKKLQQEKMEKAKDLVTKGQKYYRDEKYDDAINMAEEALKIEPLYAPADQLKKQAVQKKEAQKEAEAKRIAHEKEIKERQKAIDKLLKDGELLFSREKFDQAEEKYQECIKLDPANSEARKMLSKIAEEKREAKIQKADAMVKEGEALLARNKFEEARSKFQEALTLDMNNKGAFNGLQEITRKKAASQKRVEEMARRKVVQDSQKLFDEGLKAYEDKDIETAVSKWQEALKINPDNIKAKTYLEETRQELEDYRKSRAEKEAFEKREDEAKQKMDTLISVSTTVPHTPLISYLDSLSLVSGINFYVTSGVEATVDAKFVDTPLHEVLDTLLLPIGLKWSRKAGSDIVTITPDLQTKFFNLTPEEASKVKAVIDNGDLQKILWGSDGAPKMKGVELTLDEREGILISVDSKTNIQKISAFLEDLKTQAPPGLIFRTYRLREGEGPKVKSLLEAILEADSRAPYAPERKLLLDGRDLIIKDTPENIMKVEDLLMDKGFIEKLRSDKLQVETWLLVPKEALKQNPEQLRQFGEWVIEVIKVMLYAKSTVSKAEAEGRRLWWDPTTMQLTITDYPNNIRSVADFIHSLPQLEQKKKSQIIPLRYAKADEIADKINSFLGLSGEDEGVSGAGGLSVTKSLSVGNDFTFRDMTIRLQQVNENDANDDNDDSIELKVRTPGESRDVTMDEFDSEEVDDYEIIADDVKPSTTPGEGRARLKVTYTAPYDVQQQVEETPEPTPEVTEEGEKPVQGLTDPINAIFVEYKDPAHLNQVKEWITTLDMAPKQVSIESKFVEVIESRAKQFSSQLAIADLTKGISFDDSILNMRFANDLDELQNAIASANEPAGESPSFQHLLKGTTVLSLITGGDSPINWQLRLLEAEGVVNVINGPQILVQDDKDEAEFTITRVLGGIPEVDASGNYVGGGGTTQFRPVYLNITDLFVSEMGEIEFYLDAEIVDQDALSGGTVTAQDEQGQQEASAVQYSLSRLEKNITTWVRVKDGGTIVVGGWTSERSGEYTSGIPILRQIPYVGKVLFGRNLRHIDKTTLLIFLTARIVE